MADHAHGGNDVLGLGFLTPCPVTIYVDAKTMAGHAVGGNDTISGSGYGDAATLSDYAVAATT